MEPKEPIKKIYSNKKVLKTLLAATIIGGTLYVGDAVNLSHKVKKAYNETTEYIENIFTCPEPKVIVQEPKNLHAYSDKYISKIFAEKEPAKYEKDFAKVMFATSKNIDDSLAVLVINERVNDMNLESKYDVMKNSMKTFLKGNKEGLERVMKNIYTEMKDMYKHNPQQDRK